MPTWHEFKNSIVVEMIFLHMEPFMNSYVQLVVVVEYWPLKCCISSPNKWPVARCDYSSSHV